MWQKFKKEKTMTKSKAIILSAILGILFLAIPAFVIVKAANIKSGYKGLVWGQTEYQVKEWIKKNNNNIVWSKCPLSHYGVTCTKLTWKKNEQSPFEYIEFQFKNGKLAAVIETEHEKPFTPEVLYSYGRSENGTDLAVEIYKSKGEKFQLRDYVNYYSPMQKFNGTKKRYAVEILFKKNLTDTTVPEEKIFYLLTTGYYSPEYYDEAKNHNENFPSHRFLAN